MQVPSEMLSVQRNYSRLFRPWDVSGGEKFEDDSTQTSVSEINNLNNESVKLKQKRKIVDETKRENRLRKIRGLFKKTEQIHQDDTVSTTTIDVEETKTSTTLLKTRIEKDESPVASLSLCCDRLLQEPRTQQKKEAKDEPKETNIQLSQGNNYQPTKVVHQPPNILPMAPSFSNIHQGYMPEYFPTADIAQALGVPPTDPLLLESLAQGYAMELEYARILQQENETKLLNARKQRPKKYKCPHCQVGFSNNGQLKGHIRIHTGERPFKCDENNCGKTFTRNEELTRHKRIHSGVRPFPCPTCGKKFGRRDHLKKHTRTHYLQAERMMPVFVPLSAVPHVGFPYLYGY